MCQKKEPTKAKNMNIKPKSKLNSAIVETTED